VRLGYSEAERVVIERYMMQVSQILRGHRGERKVEAQTQTERASVSDNGVREDVKEARHR
jgi:hypothetical protein